MLPELMYQILLYSDIEDVETYCRTAKYHQLCHNRQFWIDKLINDQLFIPTILDYVNGIKSYKILKQITFHLKNSNNEERVYTEINGNLLMLLKKYNMIGDFIDISFGGMGP